MAKSAYPELQVGPEDNLDEAAGLGSNLGSAKKSHLIIKRVADMYPASLVSSLTLPLDHARSETLDEDEVESQAEEVLGENQSVVPGSARVRGRNAAERIVSFLVESEKGRTGRATLPYEDFSGSQEAFDEAAESAGTGERAENAKLADLQARLDEAERARDDAEAKLDEKVFGSSDDDDAEDEPFEGYDGLTAAEVAERVRDDDLSGAELDAVLRYEQQNQNRKGVVDAVSKARGG